MKKKILLTVWGVSLLTVLSFSKLSAQAPQKTGEMKKPIPESVMKIAGKSCVNCHKEPGKKMAIMKVNLSKWDDYTAEKQAKKSHAMCDMVTRGKMPPKVFRLDHPADMPTPEEIKILCNWAQSLQAAK